MFVTETPTEKLEETQCQPNVEEKKADTAETKEKEIQQNTLPSYVIPTIIGVFIVASHKIDKDCNKNSLQLLS